MIKPAARKPHRSLTTSALLALGAVAACSDDATETLAGGSLGTVFDRTSHAYSFPMPGLSEDELALHTLGDLAFEAVFVAPPAPVNPGLGPTFNHNACIACHHRDGRGTLTFGAANSQALVRVSLPGTADMELGAVPVPGVGLQLQDHAVFGEASEGRVELAWLDVPFTYDDGTTIILRKPQLALYDLNEQALTDVQTSLRIGPAVFGLGLLAAVTDDDVEALADPDDRDGDGISGRVNMVWDVARAELVPGRFGWKANAPTLRQQAAGAYANDMGVRSELFPEADQTHELPTTELDRAEFYLQTLAVPHRATLSAAAARGEGLFRAFECDGCHTPTLQTGPQAIAALDRQRIMPYTDLLLHDMGDGLADGRADFAASGREWRTTPLWGLGLVKTVLINATYLHDGRARSVEEAILWHDGEAAAAKAAFALASAPTRSDLLEFLAHL